MASSLSIAHATLDWKRQNPPKGPDFDWEMYRYVPSMAGAIVCLVVFLVMALLHLYQFLKSRNRIIVFVVIGALCTLLTLSAFSCQNHLGSLLMNDYRRSWRVRHTHRFALRQSSLGPVHHSRCTDTCRSFVVRRNHIHDAWPYHQTRRRRRRQSNPSEMVHEDLRYCGCHNVDHPGLRYANLTKMRTAKM